MFWVKINVKRNMKLILFNLTRTRMVENGRT